MKRFATILVLLLIGSVAVFAQMTETANHNAYDTKSAWTGPDSTMPYEGDQGVRTVWVTQDCDKDGKPEILATDYSNRGRVHVFEMSGPNTLELVWSSPRHQPGGGGSTPRWARDGDLDGDGNREIIFPWYNSGDSAVQVYEYQGSDNDWGTTAALELPMNLFAPQGVGNFRMNREVGGVFDADGDGRDELITVNRDHKVYILGVVGDVGGFGSWQLEGGDPAVHPDNRFSGGSQWQSVQADIDGDGMKEIVNHYWNFYGFWSIDPMGADSYRYPMPSVDSATIDAAKTDFYHEYCPSDAVSYMGLTVADVDGDNKDEIAGVLYIGGTDPLNYDVSLVSLTTADTGVYVWRDSTQYGTLGENLWEIAGKTAGSHWGHAAYDFNENGREELLIGGSAEFNIIGLEYKGSGDILDGANYDKTVLYPGDVALYHEIDYYDSAGVVDTVRRESPFVSKMYAGSDLDGNSMKEAVLAYQSVADSITYTRYVYNPQGIPPTFEQDSTWKEVNQNAINIRVVEYTGATGFRELPLTIVTPEDYVLEQNYPNPFNPSTNIGFTLPVNKKISLVIYDMLGKEVKTLIGDEQYDKGTHRVTWDGTNNSGLRVASGNYIYMLRFGNFSKSAKMTLLK
jgi:hypothetical protein